MLVSNFHGPWLVDVVASLISMGCLALFLKVWKPKTIWTSLDRNAVPAASLGAAAVNDMSAPRPRHTAAEVRRAWLPWIILSVLVFLWGLEVMGVLIGAGSAFSVTFGDRPPDRFLDWFVAAPMVALATIELMRIYLARAFCYHRNILLRLFVVLGLVLCVGVAFENWSIGIERLVDRRFSDIEHKREEVAGGGRRH